jgi:acyl-CoA thioester hydrolase
VAEPFRHRLRVRYNECDPQNVVFNANYLTYFDITITELWRELGGYEAMVGNGVDIVVAEVRVRFLGPLRFDDEFEVQAAIGRLGNTSIATNLTVVKEDRAVAEGEVRHVFIDTANGDTAPIPDTVRSGLAKYVAEQTV